MLESKYKSDLSKRIEKRWPGCVVTRLDSSHIQGIPDLLILYKNMWAVLEAKRSDREPFQPNQEYYLEKLGAMSFAAVIYPQNEEVVLNALQRSFETGGAAFHA